MNPEKIKRLLKEKENIHLEFKERLLHCLATFLKPSMLCLTGMEVIFF
jgi:hypothetical protein